MKATSDKNINQSQLTSLSKVPLQNLAVALLENSLYNYDTRRFTTMFTVPPY